MSSSKNTLILRSKGIILGRVESVHQDWPWCRGQFHPTDDYSQFATVFSDAARLRKAASPERVELDRLIRQIVEMELQLIHEESGELAGEPDLLWIDGENISWRGHTGALRKKPDTPPQSHQQ